VETLDAREALAKYRPEVVLACWPDPGNSWEASVLQSPSTRVYIVLGSRTPGVTGQPTLYDAPGAFRRSSRPDLARWLLPPSLQPEVLVFTRNFP